MLWLYDLVKVAICDELSKKRKEIVMFDSRLQRFLLIAIFDELRYFFILTEHVYPTVGVDFLVLLWFLELLSDFVLVGA